MPKSRKFPKTVYIRWEGDSGEQYLDATETIAGKEDGDTVAIYQLVEVKTMKVTEALV